MRMQAPNRAPGGNNNRYQPNASANYVSIGDPPPLMSLNVENETTMKSFRTAISDVKVHVADDDGIIYAPPRQIEPNEHLNEAFGSNQST